MKHTRIEFSFKQREVWQISRKSDVAETPACPFCAEFTPMLAAESLAQTFKVSPREIFRLIERGALHFIETERKEIFVCLESFSKRSLENNEETVSVKL